MFDTVGQFIAVTGLGRKMRGQQFAGFLDAVDDAGSEIGFLKMAGHLTGQPLPKGVTAFLMHGSVADDGKFSGARRDKNQNPVVVACLRHAKPFELILGGGDGVLYFLVADENTDFAGSFFLGILDGGDDVVMPQLVEKIVGFHITSSLPRRRRQNCRRHRKNRHRHRPKKIRRPTNHRRLTTRFHRNSDC